MKKPFRVIVAGAGIGGLTAALALLRQGFEVEVLEKSPELGEVGAGLQISPNGSGDARHRPCAYPQSRHDRRQPGRRCALRAKRR
jgi:2-polyprenyl-6-methoxyphenol hydroxylase-like FAD-dependent oxidoreductase